MTPVERVARAIYQKRNGVGCTPWGRLPRSHQEPYVSDARAALAAMREPSEGMVEAGRMAKLAPGYTENGAEELPVWDNMSCPSQSEAADWEAVFPGLTKNGFWHSSYEWPEWQRNLFTVAFTAMIDKALEEG